MPAALAPVTDRPRMAPSNGMQRKLAYAALGLLALVAFACQIRYSFDILSDLGQSARVPFFMSTQPVAIIGVQPEATKAGLRKQDVVVALNGKKLTGTNVFWQTFGSPRPGTRVDVDVLRDHRPMRFTVVLAPSDQQLSRATNIGLIIVIGIFLPWSSLLLGFYVAAVRPTDSLAWIVLGLLISFSQAVNVDASTWPAWIRLPSVVYHITSYGFWPMFMFLFGYYFPRPLAMDQKHPRLKWILLAPYIAWVAFYVPVTVGVQHNLERFGGLFHLVATAAPYVLIVLSLMVGLGITLLGVKSGREKMPDARRRLRLLLWGIVISLTPLLVLGIFSFFLKKPIDLTPPWIFLPALLALVLFPLTLAYVIVVDRAMDLRVVLRQGLQYAFFRGGVVVLRFLSFSLFSSVGLVIAQKLNGNPVPLVLLALVLLAAVIFVNVTMKRLGAWVDRRFFRDAYNAELVLSELSEQVRSIREARPLIETVCDRIAKALHVSKIAVLLERDGAYETCHSSGFDPLPSVVFSKSSGVVSYLLHTQEAPRVYFEDESSWLYRAPGLDDDQRSRLAYLGAELLLPLATRDHLLGFIAAGQKRSEEPYSNSDVRILSSVAAQTGLALENAQLITTVAREVAQRERLASEVEIAREVQERLFPQTLPAVPGLDYAGMCRTALGVGGDYYDFLALAPDRAGVRRFGFAVGDVAGKGISAALVMAGLQASLRGEASYSTENLAGLMSNLNRRVYEASTTNRYATFFYGQYDPIGRAFDFVNAGHNPPILMRREAGEWQVTLLEAGGTVIGLLPATTYQQSSLQLRAGDYLVLFTDGVSEAMNKGDEEWGEERLTETIRACAESSLSASDTMRRILSAADTFVDGARQNDDMTLVVLRVLETS